MAKNNKGKGRKRMEIQLEVRQNFEFSPQAIYYRISMAQKKANGYFCSGKHNIPQLTEIFSGLGNAVCLFWCVHLQT